MTRSNPCRTYRQTQVMTASPERLVGMLYEGAARLMREAQRRAEDDDWHGFRDHLFRAGCVIDELLLSLDPDQGGEVADSLGALYGYVKSALVDGFVSSAWEPVEPALQVVEGLRETWDELCQVRT